MRWLRNTYDPRHKDAYAHVDRFSDETVGEAWQRYQEWLSDKIIGDPKAVGPDSVEQLKRMHLVGVYADDPF